VLSWCCLALVLPRPKAVGLGLREKVFREEGRELYHWNVSGVRRRGPYSKSKEIV
jgi:hypothetical protein